MRISIAIVLAFAGTTTFSAHRVLAERSKDPSSEANDTTIESVLSQSQQLLVVRSESWNNHSGSLQRYRRDSPEWVAVGASVPVSLGRRGLAWGRGLVPSEMFPLKKQEGDGRSPAGIFSLGTAFGESERLPDAAHGYPYLQSGSSSYCVEDTRSDFYNEIIDANTVKTKGWQRWSALARPDRLFQWGIFVNQNTKPARIGAGSCIFLHVWKGAGIGTAGCTAMPKEAISEIIAWLDPSAHPLLVQLPTEAYGELSLKLDLPRRD